MYNWQYKNWPHFSYKEEELVDIALQLAQSFGEASGLMQAISKEDQQDALLQLMISEAMNTSQIEGEYLSREDVMSSIKRQLGIKVPNVYVKDAKARGVGQLMVVARSEFDKPLTIQLIQDWHSILFTENKYIHVGQWRTGSEPMQIISGAFGKEIVHYEAPPSTIVLKEMDQFISWYNNYKTDGNVLKILVKTAITHLYFESIHPFEDGNGRIGRALAEKCLSQELGYPIAISISTAIERNKNEYYDSLKKAQQSLAITDWILYFGRLILDAQVFTQSLIQYLLKKSKFYSVYNNQLNERQKKALNKMWDAGIDGFDGGMTAKKYISITKTSKATATRDLQQLVEIGAFQVGGSGRNVHYSLVK